MTLPSISVTLHNSSQPSILIEQNGGSNNNEEITINLVVKKTVPIRVKKKDPIKNLKQICLREGISESLQKIYHGDRLLEDELTLEHYGINSNATIKVELNTVCDFARRMYVKIPFNQRMVEVHVTGSDNSEMVKSIVVAKEGLHPDHFDLMYNGRILRSHQTIASVNMTNNSLLYLAIRPRDTMTIKVVTYSRGVIPFEAKKLQTVGNVIWLLASMTSSQIEGAKLYHAGTMLEDLRTIESYGIEENGLVQLMTTIPIHVMFQAGNFVTVNVYPSDDRNEVKAMVIKKLNGPVSEDSLLFNGERLVEGRPIAHYNIVEGSILQIS